MRNTATLDAPTTGGKRLVAKNSIWQIVGFGARAVSGIGVVVLVARSGGPRSLGVFQFALTLTAMLPFYFGLPSLLAREVARRPEDGPRWADVGTLIAILFGVVFTVALTAGAWLVGASPSTTAAIPIAGIGMAFDGVARVQFATMWAWERIDLEAKVTLVQEAFLLISAAALLSAGGGAQAAVIAFTASRALGAVLGWFVVGRHYGALPVPRASREFLRGTLKQCTPFAINDTLTLTYMRADAVMLGIFKGPVAVGLYQAGTNLVLYLNVVARSINHALYPRMSKAWPDRLNEFRRLRDGSFRAIGLLGVPVAVASLLLAPRTFHFLYGDEFDRAVLTYQLLVLIIPVRMLGNTLSLALSSADLQTKRTVAVTAAAALNIGLNLYFIPTWSYLGAAITTVICESGLLVVYALFMRQAAGPSEIIRSVSLPALASLPMALVIVATRNQHVIVSGIAGVAAYGITLLAVALVKAGPNAHQRPVRAVVGLLRPAT